MGNGFAEIKDLRVVKGNQGARGFRGPRETMTMECWIPLSWFAPHSSNKGSSAAQCPLLCRPIRSADALVCKVRKEWPAATAWEWNHTPVSTEQIRRCAANFLTKESQGGRRLRLQ
eukprot:scaffold21255_cov33-Tisochrysis_lutea.AAC.6